MNVYAEASRKNIKEDRIAICPKYGCEYMTRVKPLKFRFFGFGKHPKCKKHHLSLVYADEMIGNFTDAVLACFFDKSALPPSELIKKINAKFPQELESFVRGWVYCITIGRGAPIVSRFMDGISNGYLKQLSRKQKKGLRKGDDANTKKLSKAIKDGMKEITTQYTRLLKHLRIHSEILNDHLKLNPLSKSFRSFLNEWQREILKNNKLLKELENRFEMSLIEIKQNYDEILNIVTCRCLLGLNPESREIKKARISSFDRFSAYYEFYEEGLTSKFTKSDISNLFRSGRNNVVLKHSDIERDTINKSIITRYGNSYRVNHNYMLILSKYLFQELEKSNKFNLENLVHITFDKLKSDFVSPFWELEDFKTNIKKYCRDLVTIIKYFSDRVNRDNSDILNISHIARNFIDKGVDLNNGFQRLRQNLRDIFLYLKEEVSEFNLEKIDKINLEKDKNGKVCGKCGIYKPFSQFFLRPDGQYKSSCKDCYYQKNQIYIYQKKYRLIQEMQNGKFQGKCGNADCRIDFRMLPAIDIHHPKNKSFTWRKILKQDYDTIKHILDDSDNAIPLCRNCHSITYKLFYSHYKELINELYYLVSNPLKLKIFKEFKKEIKKRVLNYGLLDQYSYGITRTKIMAWLRKKIVINSIYNGMCANCGETDIGKLEFHHMDPSLKNLYIHKNPNLDRLNIWKTFTLSNTTEAGERVVFEECICLCANCHAMITSKYFVENSTKILSTEYYLERKGERVKLNLEGKRFSDEIKGNYDKLRYNCEKAYNRIKKFKTSGVNMINIPF